MLQQWYSLSDPAMAEALISDPIPDATTILTSAATCLRSTIWAISFLKASMAASSQIDEQTNGPCIVRSANSSSTPASPLSRQRFQTTVIGARNHLDTQVQRDRWCIQTWHWLPGSQLHEDDHRYGCPGAEVLATLRTLALNLLR